MKVLNIFKDFILSILIVTCIVVIICLIFYDDISLNKVIPESQEFTLSEEMTKEIEEEKLDEMQEVVTKYSIDASDLKQYEKTNEYNKGKKNPFAKDETPPETSSNDDPSKNNGNSSNFYEDDGTK